MDKTTSELMIQESQIRRLNEGELSARITRLEIALTATVRALAFGETTYPGGHPEKHGLCGQETAEHLARAAQALGLDLADLGLAYAVTRRC